MTMNKDAGLEQRFNDAALLKANGKLHESVQQFCQIAHEYPDFAPTFGMMGHLFWELGNIEEAINCFRTVVKLSPQSELGSLGLFHVLLEAKHVDEAFTEMKRFLSLADSEEYRLLLHDIKKELV